MDLIQLINQHQYLYLTEICEPEDNVLKLMVAEAKVSGPRENIVIEGVEIKDTAPIVVAEDSSVYEVIFDQYIAYSVRNESYTHLDKEEEFEGRLACIYTKSRFLDYVSVSTFASDDFPGPFKHYGFNCLNHIVDIVSTSPPKIVELRSNR
ncbi:MAG TPA: hypothetical protein VI260_12405 [Blastocatellia bacterium]|jgi:hypothetical protein